MILTLFTDHRDYQFIVPYDATMVTLSHLSRAKLAFKYLKVYDKDNDKNYTMVRLKDIEGFEVELTNRKPECYICYAN